MGNCCRRESSTMVWAGDDWGSLSSKKKLQDEKERLLHNGVVVDQECCRSSPASLSSLSYGRSGSVREVKIKMTKKELQELVGRLDLMQGFSLEQVLRSHLVNASDHNHDYRPYDHEHQRSWRPALRSIPELNY